MEIAESLENLEGLDATIMHYEHVIRIGDQAKAKPAYHSEPAK